MDDVVEVIVEYTTADVVRTVLAVALTLSFPFVLFYGSGGVDDTFARTYTDAVTAVVSFYFAVRGADTASASESGAQAVVGNSP